MIKLYGGVFSRAAIVKWYLEELQIPYEFVLVDLQSGINLQSDYLAIHPFGKVPAIADGDFILWESGAILIYLAQKYDRMLDTAEKQAIVNQWILFGNSTLGDGLFSPQNNTKETPRLLGKLDSIFASQSYLTGDRLTAADIAVGAVLNYVIMMIKDFDYSPYPNVSAYIQRLRDRPAFQASMTLK